MLGLFAQNGAKCKNTTSRPQILPFCFKMEKNATTLPQILPFSFKVEKAQRGGLLFFPKCKNATSWPQLLSFSFVYPGALLAALRSPPEAPTQAAFARLHAWV